MSKQEKIIETILHPKFPDFKAEVFEKQIGHSTRTQARIGRIYEYEGQTKMANSCDLAEVYAIHELSKAIIDGYRPQSQSKGQVYQSGSPASSRPEHQVYKAPAKQLAIPIDTKPFSDDDDIPF